MDIPPIDEESRPPSAVHDDSVVEEVIPPTEFNFSFLGTGAEEEVVLRDRIPVGDWAVIGLSFRTHAYNGSSGARFTFIVRGVAPSPDDGADFVTADLASQTLAGTSPRLQQLLVPLSDLQLPFLRVVLKAQGPTTPPGNVYAEISCDLVMKAS